jgi:dTDP-4-dehydrorhamnose reductase
VQGIIHAANGGFCSRYELAEAIVMKGGLPCRVLPCATSVYPRPAQRPAWSVLDLARLEGMGIQPRPWREALGDCLLRMQRESAA